MPLGDSVTRGWYGSVSQWGYRKPLYDNLSREGFNFDFVGSFADGNFPDPNHEGHNGWRADEILNGRTSDPGAGKLEYWLDTHQPDIILLHIGTNDITAGNQDASKVNAILNVIDNYELSSSKSVLVVLALIINRVPYSLATTQYNNNVQAMASNRIAGGDNIIIVNMENALNYSTDLSDGVHPNDSGYAKMANAWYDALADSSRNRIEEVNHRLELRNNGGPFGIPVFYNANGWNIDIAYDFEVKVDFHYSDLSVAEGWIGMNVGDDVNYVSISVGSDSNQSYFYYEAVINGGHDFEQEFRSSGDGTLYITYEAATKIFYFSHTGFGSQNGSVRTTEGQWSVPVYVEIGGGSSGAVLSSGEAYLDNFAIVDANLLNWPPPTDIDQNGYIEIYDLEIMCEHWLDSGAGDFDNSGHVDFFDLAQLGLAW
jgi:lysophospholipase L1-like esterase